MNKSGKSSPKGSKRSKKSPTPASPGSPGSPRSMPEVDPALLCPTHKQEYTLFNEVTEKPLCPACTSELTGTHKVTSLEEAYRYRQAAVRNMLTSNLLSKKEQLLARLHRTEYRLEELRRVELLTARDTKSEFQAIVDRLNASCHLKEATLANDLAELQSDLARIDYISSAVEKGADDMTLFLEQFPKLRNAAEFAAAKPFKAVIEVTPGDLPNEMERLGECMEDKEAFTQLTAFKDEVVWRLLHERTGSGQIREDVRQELNQWVALTTKLTQELDNIQLACEYCGVPLSADSANESCGKNTGFVLANRERAGQQDKHRGNGRHFFVKPQPPTPQSSSTPAAQPYTPGNLVHPDDIIAKLRGDIRVHPIDVEALFRDYDVLHTGTVTPTDFYQIVNSAFGLNGQQVSALVGRFDKSQSGRINYMAFAQELLAEYYGFIERAKERVRSLREEFRVADSRHTDKVSKEAFSGVLRKCGFTNFDVNFAFRLAEVTADGEVLYQQLLAKLMNS